VTKEELAMAELEAAQVWEETKKVLLDKLPFNLGVFDAFNACVPITIDEDTLVLGMTTAQMHMGGHLQTPDNRNAITQVLHQKIGPNAKYILIDGSTVDHWEVAKARHVRAAASEHQQVQDRQGRRTMVDSVDELSQELYRRHGDLKNKQFPQIRARFIAECIPLLADAEERMRQQSGLNEDQFIRQWARLLDRLARWTEVGATIIALEVARYRGAKAAQSKQ